MLLWEKTAATLAAVFLSCAAHALDRTALEKLASDDNDEKIAAIAALVAEADPQAAKLLAQAAEGEIEIDGKKVEIVVNNRVRGRIAEALAVLRLLSNEKSERLAAAQALAGGADAAMLPLILKARDSERDPEIKALLEMTAAAIEIKSEDKASRLAAIRALAQSAAPSSKTLLLEAARDADEDIRVAAQKSLCS